MTTRALVGDGDVSPDAVFELAKAHDATMVDLKFTDLPGTWQHMGMALGTLEADSFTDGIGFDGSSIRGFQEIYESDMLLMPDASSAIVDPFYEQTTIS
ncbi:MAG: glutamine synthetase, partial [Actinomycetota bacterium]|nr:glutamine synthetase [Actinomycetota bacterium]